MYKKQCGVFFIELSFILFFISVLLLFTGDVAFKLFNRVALDRASYSLVNIVKERHLFYNDRIDLNQQDINDISNLASRLLPESHFIGVDVQSLYKGVNKRFSSNGGCSVATISKNLVPENISGTVFPIYQVTLCYEIENWLDKFLISTRKSRLQSTSVIVGR